MLKSIDYSISHTPTPLKRGKNNIIMTIKLYEKNNNPKDLARIVEVLKEGGIIIYPTDTMYAIG